MKQFVLPIILAVVISSLTTYFVTTMSLQNDLNEKRAPVTSESTLLEITDQQGVEENDEAEKKLPITSDAVKVELSCSEPCDDGNPCSYDYCNETTDFKCKHAILKGEVEGCKGMLEGSCSKYSCVYGSCTLVYSSVCCGNGKCDSDEDYSLCPRDCEKPQSTETQTTEQTTSAQTLSLTLAISVAKNPIVRGNEQTITIKVTDSSNAINGASVSSTVTYASGTPKDFSGSTNANGEYSYTWKIGGNSNPGTFTVTATASKSGYTSGSASTSFQVTTASG